MKRKEKAIFSVTVLLCLCGLASLIHAQETVTTIGGNTNTIPYYTGSATVANSDMYFTPSNGFIGIGTGAPTFQLDVNGDLNFSGQALRYQGVPVFQGNPGLANFFFGRSGNTSATAGGNIALGYTALASVSSGGFNVAVGNSAMNANTTGQSNVAVGVGALYVNTTGYYNTAVGPFSLVSNISGFENAATGAGALQSLTTGNSNTATGSAALQSLDSGSNNNAVGVNSLTGLVTGTDNSALGDGAGDDTPQGPNASSIQNTYLGASTQSLLSGDTNETVIGAYAVGHGTNSVTLGNTSVTSTYLQGNVYINGVGANGSPAALFINGSQFTGSGGSDGSGSASLPQVNGNSQISGVLQVTGALNPTTTTQGGYFGWDALTGGTGETDFINNQGAGSGGFAFFNTPSSGSPRSLLMFLGTSYTGMDLQTLPIASRPSTSTPILEVSGSIALNQGGGGQVFYQDGTVQSTAWNGTTLGGDYAEAVDVMGDRTSYEAGDVIVIDAASPGKFAKSDKAYSKLVAGVYSTKPGLVGRRTTVARPNKQAEVPMAMMGIVPVKVSTENGPVEPGDLLVSSSRPGYAMKGTDGTRIVGAVIGKALAPLEGGDAVIEALVSLQ